MELRAQMPEALLSGAVVAAFLTFLGGILSYFIKEHRKERSANRAILAEVRRLAAVCEEHRRWWDGRVKAADLDHPLIPFAAPVYGSQLASIGLLYPDVVAKVVEFYGYVGFVNDLQTKQIVYAGKGQAKVFAEMYLHSICRLTSLGMSMAGMFQKYDV